MYLIDLYLPAWAAELQPMETAGGIIIRHDMGVQGHGIRHDEANVYTYMYMLCLWEKERHMVALLLCDDGLRCQIVTDLDGLLSTC